MNCERLLRRDCPIINFVLLQLELYVRLSYDDLLSDEGRRLARECGEILRQWLARRGVYIVE